MKLHKYTEEQLRQACKESFSIRQVLQKLNVVEAGGNYATMHKAIAYFQIDTSHFTGQLWSKGREVGHKKPIKEYLLNNFSTSSNRLRLRLIKEGYFQHQCSKCNLTKWNGQPIPLELEHKNGNHKDNTLSNLELLCPNCHAQTSTYRGRKLKKNQ